MLIKLFSLLATVWLSVCFAHRGIQTNRQGGKRRRGRRKKTWQDTLRDDLQATDVSWEEAKSVAGDQGLK